MTTKRFRSAVKKAMAEGGMLLVTITHDTFEAPVRLASHGLVRLSTEPYAMGVRSRMIGSELFPAASETSAPLDFYFALKDIELPGDEEGGPTTSSLVFAALDDAITDTAKNLATRARVDIALVLVETPDYIDAEWTGLVTGQPEGSINDITVPISREDRSQEPWPARRATKNIRPALHAS